MKEYTNVSYPSASVGSTPQKSTHVSDELQALRGAINLLSDNFGFLLTKLEPVIRTSEMVEETNKLVAPEKNIVGLASTIRDERKRIESLSNSINSINSRLEL